MFHLVAEAAAQAPTRALSCARSPHVVSSEATSAASFSRLCHHEAIGAQSATRITPLQRWAAAAAAAATTRLGSTNTVGVPRATHALAPELIALRWCRTCAFEPLTWQQCVVRRPEVRPDVGNDIIFQCSCKISRWPAQQAHDLDSEFAEPAM